MRVEILFLIYRNQAKPYKRFLAIDKLLGYYLCTLTIVFVGNPCPLIFATWSVNDSDLLYLKCFGIPDSYIYFYLVQYSYLCSVLQQFANCL